MKHILFSAIFLFLCNFCFSATDSENTEEAMPVVVDGETVDYESEKQLITAEGDVKISYKGIKAFCDKAEVSTQTKIGWLTGDVRLEHEDGTIYGENVIYDFQNRTAEINKMYLNSETFYVAAESADKVSEEKYVLNDGCFTTCGPLNEPQHFFDYRIESRKIEFYPGRKIVAKDVIFKIGDVPILYIPYYLQPAKDKLPRVTLVPGSDSEMGLFMKSAWRYYFNEAFKGRIHLDWYQHKGFGRGFTHKYHTDDYGEGIAKLYYIGDRDKRSFDEDNPVWVGSDRYKAQIRHQWQVTPNLSTKIEFHKFSDKYFMEDYFYREYERDNQPESYLLTTYSLPYASLSLFAQKRVNRFFTQTEYLPRLKLDVFRRRIGKTNFYFDADYSMSNLAYKRAAPSDNDDDVFRVDTLNRITYQEKLAWLNFQPFVSMRETYYSKNKTGEEDIFRAAFSSGVELSTKLYKQLSEDFDFFGIKAGRMRHIITPIVKYEYTHRPTVSKNVLMQFDSVDDIERENKMTFTLENKIQAKNENKVWDMLYFAPSVSYVFNEEARGSHFHKLTNNLEFRPFDDLYFEQKYEYDLDKQRTEEITSDVVWNFLDCELKAGHRYVRNEDSEIHTSFKYRISPKWEFTNRIRYDAKRGDTTEQEYFFTHELNCWFVDFGLSVDEDYEKTIWVVFRVKAFPESGIQFHGSFGDPKGE